jgi:hypothetical protein
MKRALLIPVFLALFILVVPVPTQAASATFFGPIFPEECKCTDVPIEGGTGVIRTAPDYGCVLQALQNTVNFAVTFASILFTFYLVIAGFQFLISQSSGEALGKAKTRITNVILGLIVLLISWLLVDFVMKKIYNDEGFFGPWNSILGSDTSGKDRCIIATQPDGLFGGTANILFGDPGDTSGGGGGGGGGDTDGVVGGGIGGNTKMDIGKAARYALSNARSGSTGSCALYVRKALAAGGLTSFNASHPRSAYQYGPYLERAGFKPVKRGVYSPSLEGNMSGLQAGDVVVFNKVPGHPHGHIAIYTGSKWVSDYVQPRMSSNSKNYTGGSYIIYRP